MNSNFRSASGWKDTAYNSLSASYSYGYAGGRTDLPATGYDPVYPSPTATTWTPSQDFGNTSYNYTASYQPSDNNRRPSAPYQQEYNPEYPSYTNSYDKSQYTQQHQEYQPTSTSYIAVNSSAFSVGNALRSQQQQRNQNTRRNFPNTRTTSFSTSNREGGNWRQKPISNLVALNNSSISTRGVSGRNTRKTTGGPRVQSTPNTTFGSPIKTDSDIIEIKTVKSTNSTVKIPGNTKNRGGGRQQRKSGGVNKRRSMESTGNQQQQGSSGGFRGRGGGRGRGRGLRRGAPRPTNRQDDIPFVALQESDSAITLSIDPDNLICFHGPSNVFTTQHAFPVMIEHKIYQSIDHYYQIQKVQDLCGNVSEKLTETVRDRTGRRLDGKIGFRSHEEKSFSQIARESVKLGNVDKAKVDEWRNTKGLEVVQTAFMAKVSQSAHLREALKETNDKILVHAYAGDSIYGAGTTIPQIRNWCEDMKKNGTTTMKIPATFPLTSETIQSCPNFAQGRNVLGVILMQLRDLLQKGRVDIVDMTAIFDALKGGGASTDDDILMEDGGAGDGFAIGGGNVQAKIGAAVPN